MLIGGWAVDAHNPWFGSTDIDLVTSSDLQHSIEYALVKERGFVKDRESDRTIRVFRPIENDKRIIIDFMAKDQDQRFEGRQDKIRLSMLRGRTIEVRCRNRVPIQVPKRATLGFLKLKAAWDRSYRVEHGTSSDKEWEIGKIQKDHCDILALIDPAAGGGEFDLLEFAELARPYEFLRDTLIRIKEDDQAVARYRRMKSADAKKTLDIIISSTWS